MQGVTSIMYFVNLLICDLALSTLNIFLTYVVSYFLMRNNLETPDPRQIYFAGIFFIGTVLWNASFITQSTHLV